MSRLPTWLLVPFGLALFGLYWALGLLCPCCGHVRYPGKCPRCGWVFGDET